MLLRVSACFGLAALIGYGLGSQLSWEEWQPIGWLVILGGGALAVTTTGGIERVETWLVAAPSLTFFAGYTVFYWRLPTWQVVDVMAIGCFIGAGLLNLRRLPVFRGNE
jgi:hypothetical protein